MKKCCRSDAPAPQIGPGLIKHEFAEPPADEFILGDLREQGFAEAAVASIHEIYQLAADMGGAGYIFTREHDANAMHNSVNINLNTLEYGLKAG
jgi:hypothetical protein